MVDCLLRSIWRTAGDRSIAARTVGRGCDFVYAAIGDNFRIAFSQIMPAEEQDNTIVFPKLARALFRSLGIRIVPVMSGDDSWFNVLFRLFCFQRTPGRMQASIMLTDIIGKV